MSTYTIQVDDDLITQKINDIINDVMNRQLHIKGSSTSEVIASAVASIVYSRKDEIIDMVVERASREIAKKGLVKLLDRKEIG